MSAAEPLFLIPVRGGSKSVPRKNLRTVAGTSLLGRAVHRALRARQLLGGAGRAVVDTADPAIARQALRYGRASPRYPPPQPSHPRARTPPTCDKSHPCSGREFSLRLRIANAKPSGNSPPPGPPAMTFPPGVQPPLGHLVMSGEARASGDLREISRAPGWHRACCVCA